jgi:hypothetical protein
MIDPKYESSEKGISGFQEMPPENENYISQPANALYSCKYKRGKSMTIENKLEIKCGDGIFFVCTENELRRELRSKHETVTATYEVPELFREFFRQMINTNPWQPMETAPKDREILLYFPASKMALPAKWEQVGWASDTDYVFAPEEEDFRCYAWLLSETCKYYGYGDCIVYPYDEECEQPTAWMEIPEEK